MLNLILSRARAAELDAHVRAIDTQRRRADRAAATAKMTGPPRRAHAARRRAAFPDPVRAMIAEA
jgi:hypothetical protein